MKKEKILVIAPHHDDEVLGCGGYINQNLKIGNKVVILIVTNGWTGVRKKMSKKSKIAHREKECLNAGKILGVKEYIFLRKEDRTIYSDQNLLKDLVRAIQKLNPSQILAPHKNDSDFEHKIISNLVREAAWLAKGRVLFPKMKPAENLKSLLLYEVWAPLHRVNKVVDISNEIEAKKVSMSEYKSQLATRDYTGAIEGLNMFRGRLKGYRYAEAFEEKIL